MLLDGLAFARDMQYHKILRWGIHLKNLSDLNRHLPYNSIIELCTYSCPCILRGAWSPAFNPGSLGLYKPCMIELD
jgi:hypothetical protein